MKYQLIFYKIKYIHVFYLVKCKKNCTNNHSEGASTDELKEV